MTRRETRGRILAAGAELVHQKGFNNTGIQEILQAAGVPRGSFYFYFKNKQEFGLALIDFYGQFFRTMVNTHLQAEDRPPLVRLKSFFDAFLEICKSKAAPEGCPIGNMTQEMGHLNDAFQTKLRDAFRTMRAEIASCLEEARTAGHIDPTHEPHEMADFMINSWEGALLRMKAERSVEPLVLFDKIVFKSLLPM